MSVTYTVRLDDGRVTSGLSYDEAKQLLIANLQVGGLIQRDVTYPWWKRLLCSISQHAY